MMDSEIEKSTQGLLDAIRRSAEYAEYVQSREEIEKQPEKKRTADSYRRKNYIQLVDAYPGDVEKVRLELSAEREQLREDPVIDRYLNAEAVLCRTLRMISIDVMNVAELDTEMLRDVL